MLSLCCIEVGQWPEGFIASNPTSCHRLSVANDHVLCCHVTETTCRQKPDDISRTDDSSSGCNDSLDSSDSDTRTTALTSNSGHVLDKTLGGLINAGGRTVMPYRWSPSCSSISAELYGSSANHDSFRLCQISGAPSVASDVMTYTVTRNDSDTTDDTSDDTSSDTSEFEVST